MMNPSRNNFNLLFHPSLLRTSGEIVNKQIRFFRLQLAIYLSGLPTGCSQRGILKGASKQENNQARRENTKSSQHRAKKKQPTDVTDSKEQKNYYRKSSATANRYTRRDTQTT